jgi:hypothetical protein
MTSKVTSPTVISFSGGRTSAYMTHRMLTEVPGDYVVLFANTGREHPKTLDFIRNCDEQMGFNTVWVEAVIHHGERRAPTHTIVNYATADRSGAVFEQQIIKYGIPNVTAPGCTRDLKRRPIEDYIQSIGLPVKTTPLALGIRADEKRRVKHSEERVVVYPLVDWWPVDKEDVLTWWEDQAFDLDIDEFEGNCQGCYKKSLKKQFLQIDRDPSVYEWTHRMEERYRFTGAQEGHRHFFRGDTSTVELLAEHARVSGNYRRQGSFDFEVGGCGESCELYETE